jgi:hypothetical protein
MMMLARLLGFVVVVIGIVVAVKPGTFKVMINFWKKGKNFYIAGGMRLFFGIMFFVIAPGCMVPGVIYTLGILMIIGGITIFVIGREKVLKMLEWWENKPVSLIRILALVPMLIGALIIYSV